MHLNAERDVGGHVLSMSSVPVPIQATGSFLT
jgi:hypothetical protein